jgi:peptide/nickel transport system permease protein
MRRFLRNPTGVASGAWLLLMLICAVFAGQIAPYNPQLQDLAVAKSNPTGAHWLGTDQLGRDVLSQLIYGAQPALIGVVCALASWLVLGVTFGMLAGYLRGTADTVVSRVTELLMALPGLVILLVVFSIFPNSSARRAWRGWSARSRCPSVTTCTCRRPGCSACPARGS